MTTNNTNQIVGILNTSIITADGNYTLTTISTEEAQFIARNNQILSAVGHEATAQVLTTILGVDVPVNRIMYSQEVGQKAIVLKINGRIPEGKILSLEDIEQIGYTLKLMVRNG